MRRSKWFAGAWILAALCSGAGAQYQRPTITNGVGLDQKLNAPVPLDLFFRDEANQSVPLRTYFGDRPVMLALVYYRCPSLCNLTLNEMVHSLRRVSLDPGRDYNVVIVSIDPSETPQLAAEKKASYAAEFGRPAAFQAGWHFLTGTQDSISRLAAGVGFRYRWDEPTHQFIHVGGIMTATPEGKLARYFYGIRYAPADLRLSLVEASQHKIGTPTDQFLLFCFHYDAAQGKYTATIFNILKLAAGVTLAGLAALVFFLLRREKKQQARTKWSEAHHAV